MKKEMRADKLLTTIGFGSRSEVKKIIKAGRLLKNGVPVQRPEEKLRPERDQLLLDGAPLRYEEYEYWVLNKPAGILTATEDRRRETVISYMGMSRKGMSPCGRLDLDTEGLLLVTDDGALIHRLLSPARHVDKTYAVHYDGVLPSDAPERFRRGIPLEDGTPCMPAVLRNIQNADKRGTALLTLQEGKFHQVKRMFQAFGCTVTHLKRLSMGPLSLEALRLGAGAYRQLTPEEVLMLKRFSQGETKTAVLPSPQDFSACIFDLDGTLVDSMWMWHDIDRRYLARFGLSYPEDLQLKIAGMSFPEVAVYFKEHFRITDSLDTMMRDWEEMSVETYRTSVPLKAGAAEMLRFLKDQGIRTAIATSNATRMVDAVLEALNIRSFFPVIVTASEVGAGKPKPDIYLEAARRLSVAPEHCLVFEDIPEGICAGKSAGMTVCAVRDDFSAPLEAVKRELADFLISDYRELL